MKKKSIWGFMFRNIVPEFRIVECLKDKLGVTKNQIVALGQNNADEKPIVYELIENEKGFKLTLNLYINTDDLKLDIDEADLGLYLAQILQEDILFPPPNSLFDTQLIGDEWVLAKKNGDTFLVLENDEYDFNIDENEEMMKRISL